MKLKLQSLKPNPFRDLLIDPIDEDRVELLRKSIHDYGFWTGTVARKNGGGGYEVAAGITRVHAALKEGIEEAEIFVSNYSDRTMLQIYATENATQRGNTSTAIAGTVASAITQIAKLLIANAAHLCGFQQTSAKSIEVARGNLMNGQGVGRDLIEAYLHGVPGITRNVIGEQLAILKSSGHYQRLMTEIAAQAEITHADEAAEVEELEKEEATAPTVKAKKRAQRRLNKTSLHAARRTAKNVEKDKITFDYAGVASHLKNAHQISAFKRSVESAGVAPVLPVENQAPLAKEIARIAADTDTELSGEFIRQNISVMVGDARFRSTLATKQQLQEALNTRVRDNFDKHVTRVCQDVRLLVSAEVRLVEIVKSNPEISLNPPMQLKSSINAAHDALAQMREIFEL